MGPNSTDRWLECPKITDKEGATRSHEVGRNLLRATAALQASRNVEKPSQSKVESAIAALLGPGVSIALAPNTMSYAYKGHNIAICQQTNVSEPNDVYSTELGDVQTNPSEMAFHSCKFTISYSKRGEVEGLMSDPNRKPFIDMKPCPSHAVIKTLFDVIDAIDTAIALESA